ncbi:MAG: phosphate regulon sensor histidine kinase PhoR [Burkholderiales bacterium]|nr:phosphate regulon sensor histidine kinase PhoR [Burkholderiales bacterium]
MFNFWVPVGFRFGAVALAAVFAWLAVGPQTALLVALAGLSVLIGLHLYYLKKVSDWIRQPDALEHVGDLPPAYGAWASVFAELRRARRREARERDEVAEAFHRLVEAASALPDGIVILDRGGIIEWCNPSAEQHLGLDLARDRGFLILNLVRAPAFTEYMMRADFREPLILTDTVAGTTISVQFLPFQKTRRMVVSRDITRFTRMEATRRDFIANVSHELRTPLTVVGGFLEQLIDQPEIAPAQRQRIEATMLDQTQRMQRLIEDLLALSRLETQSGPDREEEFDARLLVEPLVAEAQALSGGRHRIAVDAVDLRLRGSPDELRSAFANLVSNAVRHTPAGGQIEIRLGAHPDGAQFAVTDNGPGIAPEHLPRLTERFYRVDKSRSRETGGTGLGLAIVKHALARHGARLEIESEPGRGSTFRAILPAARVRMVTESALPA